jgi:flagellar biosynthesis chaperone FliJ
VSARFRLATVLRVASIREKEKERELALAHREQRLAEQRCEERDAAYGGRPAEVAADAGSFLATRNLVALRARAAADAAAGRLAALEELAAARDRWMVATRDRRALDELRERHQNAQALVASRAAQRTLDDLARARKAFV